MASPPCRPCRRTRERRGPPIGEQPRSPGCRCFFTKSRKPRSTQVRVDLRSLCRPCVKAAANRSLIRPPELFLEQDRVPFGLLAGPPRPRVVLAVRPPPPQYERVELHLLAGIGRVLRIEDPVVAHRHGRPAAGHAGVHFEGGKAVAVACVPCMRESRISAED